MSVPVASWPWCSALVSICGGGLHGNNKSVEELRLALTVGGIIVDSFDEIARLGTIAEELQIRPRVMVRATTGVEAHTHEYIATAHEDQKFGFSIADGTALSSAAEVLSGTVARTDRYPLPHRLADLRRWRVRGRGGRCGCTPISQLRPAFELGELDLGGGSESPTPVPTPSSPAAGSSSSRDHCQRMFSLFISVPHLSIEPGRAISGPSTAPSTGSAPSSPLRWTAVPAASTSVDGGMSDNIRCSMRPVLGGLASRRSTAAPVLARWSASTAKAATSWSVMSSFRRTLRPATCSRCPARAPAAPWRATTTTFPDRQSLRFAVVRSRRSSDAKRLRICWHWMLDDESAARASELRTVYSAIRAQSPGRDR